MHFCSFCKDPIPQYNGRSEGHLLIAKSVEGHIHTHGCVDKKELAQELLDAASANIGVAPKIEGEGPKEVIFHNRQRLGDILVMTSGIRDFKHAFPKTRVNVITTAAHIWDHNPHIDRSLEPFYSEEVQARAKKNGKKVLEEITYADFPKHTNVVKIGPGKLTNASNRLDWHFTNAYRVSIEDALKVHIPQGESRPDIWLTDEEYAAPRPYDFPYWVICVSGEKGWGCKMFEFNKWQQVVDQNPHLHFVQIGSKGDNPPRLQGKNVIDLVGMTEDRDTGIRNLYKLFLNAEGSIGLVSFHMHLSGALSKPAVIVAGAREPVSFTRYPGHQYLATDGTLPCATTACWHCAIDKCTNLVMKEDSLEKKIPKCVDMIESVDVSRAINSYYVGGRLNIGKPSERKFKNVVKTPVSDAPILVTAPAASADLDWGQGAIDPKDWPFIEDVIKKHQVKTVLEFGAGLSTLLMSQHADVLSFETEQVWIDKVLQLVMGRQEKSHSVEIVKWNGRDMTHNLKYYDLAFVDGPANGQNREEATRLAVNAAKIVIVHDATREWESKWEEKYLKPGFQGPFKGGKWCHLWIKTPSFVPFPELPKVQVRSDAKKIKVVSTARGWGGCARSVTTIMKMLLKQGHSVEFIPFRNKVTSREFQDSLKNGLMDVKVTENYDSIKESCDVLLCYADDFVWEFPTPDIANVFSGMQAKRKVMMINYRRGAIGEVPWTRDWDRYLFLNSAQERDLLKVHPGVSTGVLPPCTDLSEFFQAQPRYDLPVRIVRHNSQGDTKFDKEKTGAEIQAALDARADLQIHMMPGPSFVAPSERFIKYSRNCPAIPKFLALGNLFWYSLPKGYMDMGPRVILEAMAAGLPILADNWGGAPDRVTPDCGWICNSKEEMIDVIKNVTAEELEAKGRAARERAFKEFRPEKWIEELTLEEVLA